MMLCYSGPAGGRGEATPDYRVSEHGCEIRLAARFGWRYCRSRKKLDSSRTRRNEQARNIRPKVREFYLFPSAPGLHKIWVASTDKPSLSLYLPFHPPTPLGKAPHWSPDYALDRIR